MDVKPRVLIALPNYEENMHRAVVTNRIHQAQKWTQAGLDFEVASTGRVFIHFGRSGLVEAALSRGFTHIFFMDDDAIVPWWVLPALIDHNVDIIGVPYAGRTWPHELFVKVADDGVHFWENEKLRNMRTDELDHGLREVAAIGTHAMLIKTEVFTRKGNPHHGAPDVPDTDDWASFADEHARGKLYFVMPRMGTEDTYFCLRAKRKGFGVYCDTDCWADHVASPTIITKTHAEEVARVKATENV